jgi:HTH-type transcriptional regulator / antitoxin HigA
MSLAVMMQPRKERMPRLDFSRPHVLRTAEEYDLAAAEVDELLDLDPEPGSEEDERLKFLSVLIRAYDEEHDPIQATSAQEIIDFMLDQHGMTRGDLAEIMGGRSRVSEFFSGKRSLSMGQVRALRAQFPGLPLDLLLDGEAVASADED